MISGAVGAAGATGAAALTGWSTRRQATIQQAGQRLQWQREKRREGYTALLDAGTQARDELAAIRRALTRPNPDLDAARQRIEEALPLVRSVRRASAAIFVDGPEAILEHTRRAEEHVVLLHELLTCVVDSLQEGRPADDHLTLCARQEVCVRELMNGFAAAARQVSTETPQPSTPVAEGPPVSASAEQELSWLLDYLSNELGCEKENIDPARPVAETGLHSIGLLQLADRARRHFGLNRDGVWPVSSLLFTMSLTQFAHYLARLRREG